LVVTGMVTYYNLNPDSPLSEAFSGVGLHWAAGIIAAGSVTTLTATTLASLLGQPRIFYQMALDWLLWKPFVKLNNSQIPIFGTIITGVFSGLIALVFDLGDLANMISIGTLLAFTVVCGSVVILRYKEPDIATYGKFSTNFPEEEDSYFLAFEPLARVLIPFVPWLIVYFVLFATVFAVSFQIGASIWARALAGVPLVGIYLLLQILRPKFIPQTFKAPLVPLFPLLGVVINIYLIVSLPVDAVYRVLVWSGVGFVIYFGYGIKHSKLNK